MFRASTESQDVCPACLNDEFGSGVAAKDFGREAFIKENSAAMRRQQARATRLSKNFRSATAYNLIGMLRCGLGVILFMICVLLFLISDGDQMTFLNQLDYTYQLCISLGTALISSLLLLPSFTRHKIVVASFWVIMLSMGATMPSMWHFKVPNVSDYEPETAEEKPGDDAALTSGRHLTDADLAYFNELKESRTRGVHYSVFVRCDLVKEDVAEGIISFGRMEQPTRNLIRTSLSRLMKGAKVEINNSADGSGVIFTVVNVPDERKNISSILNRYGRVYYSEPAEGIYELLLEPDKVKIGDGYDAAVMLDPLHPSFAELNMKALRSLDAEIVRAAASRLAEANVNRLRNDIAVRIIEALQQPWESEADTYNALAEALVVYAPHGMPQVADILWRYFQNNIRAGRGVSQRVAVRLAQEAPDKMKTPVLKLWQANPTAWNEVAGVLVEFMEPYMIEQLTKKNLSVKDLTHVMNYLQSYGTSRALPALQPYVEHGDKAITRKASNTIDSIKGRGK
ncbi:MAG: hypothetical protein E7030_02265 [Akkermansiaceae bacterium]|nr:hypothetical protein [Akkermansiaceae bacterium]